jgi:hypothetical protein
MSGGGIGIIGAQARMVDSLAYKVHQLAKIPLLKTDIQVFFDVLNVNRHVCSFSEKLLVYRTCLDSMEHNYLFCNGIFVAEIIPLQLAADIIAAANEKVLNPSDSAAAKQFVENCENVANLYFRSIVLVQPTPDCPGMQSSMNLILTGMLTDAGRKLFMQKSILSDDLVDLHNRATTVIKLAALQENHLVNEKKNAIIH